MLENKRKKCCLNCSNYTILKDYCGYYNETSSGLLKHRVTTYITRRNKCRNFTVGKSTKKNDQRYWWYAQELYREQLLEEGLIIWKLKYFYKKFRLQPRWSSKIINALISLGVIESIPDGNKTTYYLSGIFLENMEIVLTKIKMGGVIEKEMVAEC